MTKRHILTSLTLLIILVLNGGQLLYSAAAPLSPSDTPPKIEAEVWEAIATSPTRETTFIVSLRTEGDGGPEQAIDAQFRLEAMLAVMGEKGGLRDYQAFYGANIIKINSGVGVLRLLEDWPELESVSLYEEGKTWELQAESAVRSTEINASGLLIGKVTASEGVTGLTNIRVTAYRQTGIAEWEVAGSTFSSTTGEYSISGLATGIYRAKFDDPVGDYATQFYNNKPFFNLATNFDVTDGQVTPNINAALTLAGKISGTITEVGGEELADVGASAWTYTGGSWQFVANAISASNGAYTIGSLPPGTYRVRFGDIYSPPRYVVQWYDGQLAVEDAQDINVTAGVTVSNINAAMGSYGSITGNVTAEDGATNLAGIDVDAYRFRGTYWEWVSYGETDPSGNYVVNGLSTDHYRIRYTDSLGQFGSEFYNNKPDLDSADDIAVSLGYATSNINAQLSLKTNTVTNSLVTGWNLISLPVILENSTLPDAFGSISGHYSDVYAWNACETPQSWISYVPERPFNSLEAVNILQGYWINMSSPNILTLNGIHPLTTTIDLCPGWNLVGYPSLVVRPVEEALASISGKYTLVRQYRAGESKPWKTYNSDQPPTLNTLENMEPGFGYWIYMTEGATLTIDGR